MLAGIRAQLLTIADEPDLPELGNQVALLLRRFRSYQDVMGKADTHRNRAREALAEASKRLRENWAAVTYDHIESWYQDYLLFDKQGQAEQLIQFLEAGCSEPNIDLAG